MRNDIGNIIKKEFDRFFRDRRMILKVIIVPALLIYALYSLMGAGFSSSVSVADNYEFQCYVQNKPDSFVAIFNALNLNTIDVTDINQAKEDVANQDADLLILFPAGFDQIVNGAQSNVEIPNIEVFYNSSSVGSQAAYTAFTEAADQFEASIANILDVNRGTGDYDLATVSTFAMSVMPMLIISLLCSGCSNVAPESIAGEKERGTIATLLVTPVSRTAIAIGKIISLSLFALLAGISSFIGVILSFPKLLGPAAEEFSLDMYGFGEYACLLLIIISTVLLIISIVAVMSAHAKTVKEATSAVSVLSTVSLLAGIIPIFSATLSGLGWRFIPILNSVLCLNDIFLLQYNTVEIIITCVVNIIYMLGFVFILSRMFNSEKVMFSK